MKPPLFFKDCLYYNLFQKILVAILRTKMISFCEFLQCPHRRPYYAEVRIIVITSDQTAMPLAHEGAVL